MKRFSILAILAAIASMCSSAAADEPLRVGVAGVTHGHLAQVSQRVGNGVIDVVGVWDDNDTYLHNNALVGKVPADRFYTDLEQMLDATHPEVVVAYGSILDHMRVVEACAPRGIHVMVEKPLATTLEQAKRMQELADKHGVMVLTNYETTWYDTNHYAKSLVDDGRIGEVRRINVYDGHQGPIEIKCDPMFLEWLTDPVLNGGGAVIDFGCYGANLATWLLGNQRPKSVYAVLKQHKPDRYPKVDDDATIVLEYPGATVQIMGSWCWPFNRKDMHIYGMDGYIYQHDMHNIETLIDGKHDAPHHAPKLETPYNDSFEWLRAAVRGDITVGSDDLSSIENNIIVVEILESAIKSAKEGRVIELD